MEQKETASIRFYVAGCMEFENLAEYYEDLTLPQAVEIYKKIRSRNASRISGIGFELSDPALPDYSSIHWPFVTAGEIDRDFIGLIPAYANHPLVQQAIKEMEGYLPQLKKTAKHRSVPER